MATLEKRITDLESAIPDEEQMLVLVPDKNGVYKAVPDGFRGKVLRVVFVKPGQAGQPQTQLGEQTRASVSGLDGALVSPSR
jgi:hypothetical protein